MNRQPGPTKKHERPKMKSSVLLKRLWRYLEAWRSWIIIAVSLTLLSNLLGLLSPTLSGYAVDAIVPGNVEMGKVVYYVILMLLVTAFSSLLSFILSRIMIRLSTNVVKKMRKDLFNHMTTLPVSFFDTHLTGDVISILSYDVDTVGTSLSADLTQILTSAITVLGSFGMMVAISPKLLLVFIFTIPVSVLFTRYRARIVRPLFRSRSRALGMLNGYGEETVSGLKTIAAYHQQEEFNRRFREHNDEAVNAQWKADYTASVTGPSVNMINNVSLALISVFGSMMYIAGGISLGSINSFILYSRKFSGPINEFANIISDLQSSLAAAERVFSLIDLEPETEDKPDAKPITSSQGHVRFRDVSFAYNPGHTILHHIDYEAVPGQTIAIVGETGCGKTTMINLLMRFYDVSEGAIEIDGTDIRDIRREDLRKQFTMVLQDTWLFDGTVAENIAYGHPNATREDIERAAKAAHIHNMIISLPDGYDTRITDGGNSISKGQKQLLTIARAMLENSSMLILDEATSNVDTRTERLIQDAMLTLMKGRTCFVIAHRLSTIEGADRILVMDKGQIVESGTHQELLQADGLYKAMVEAQFDIPEAG